MKEKIEMEEDISYGPIVGQELPDMELESFQDGEIKKIKISDFRGQWLVLAFYPADFTFVCPTELEELANNYDKFKKLGAEVASVSTDTAFVHKAWHDNSPSIKKIKYPMLSDPTAQLCDMMGTYLPDEGLSLRCTVIVDPDGIIKSYDLHDNDIGRSCVDILRKLEAAKFVSEHKGQVCPASWKPGDKTLKPGVDLIGKI